MVYEAEWFVPGSSESVYSMKLLPERTGASACYNTKLACIAEDYGRVTVF